VGSRSIARVASALANETRARIIELLVDGPKDLDFIAREIGQSKANVSSQIRRLEEVGLVSSIYQPGERGIKKFVGNEAVVQAVRGDAGRKAGEEDKILSGLRRGSLHGRSRRPVLLRPLPPHDLQDRRGSETGSRQTEEKVKESGLRDHRP
jgi:DNA-binding transcriptional ArsR family regulator